MALLGVTLVVTSPFLYCFSRLAFWSRCRLTLTLAALNLALRIKDGAAGSRRGWIGLLFTLIGVDEDHGDSSFCRRYFGRGVAVVEQRGGSTLRADDGGCCLPSRTAFGWRSLPGLGFSATSNTISL